MNIASVAVVVDAIDENARSFTGGMVVNHRNRLFMPMNTVTQILFGIDTAEK